MSSSRHSARRWWAPGLVAALLLGTLADPAQAAAPGSLHVELGGRAGACTQAAPCVTLAQAYAVARVGQDVQVGAGRFPQQRIDAVRGHQDGSPVRFVGRGEQTVLTGATDVYAPDVVLSELTTGSVRLRGTAARSRLERVHVNGSVLMDGPFTAVVDSVVTPPPDTDGIDVRLADDALVQANRVGPGLHGPARGHVDCLQVMGGARLRVIDNVFDRCATQQVLIKADIGPITDVLLAGNRTIGCGVRTPSCDGWWSVYVSSKGAHPISDVRLTGNRIDGGLYAHDVPGLSVRGNTVARMGRCGPWAMGNRVADGSCAQASIRRMVRAASPGEDVRARVILSAVPAPRSPTGGESHVPG